ncbi:MAG: hypothetical protein ACYTGQ_12185, partial [Planctomycetota bacterium]
SALLVVSGSVVRDLLQKTFIPDLPEKTTKRLIFATTGLTGFLVFIVALDAPAFLQPLVIHYVGASGSALFCPTIATLFWKRATGRGVFAGLLGGLIVYGLAVNFNPTTLHAFIFGISGSAVLTVIGSLLSPRQNDDRLTLYFGKG